MKCYELQRRDTYKKGDISFNNIGGFWLFLKDGFVWSMKKKVIFRRGGEFYRSGCECRWNVSDYRKSPK